MLIKNLTIRNFRGIQELDWNIDQSFICLIGQGDTKKSTILDAIYYSLSPSWSLSVNDSDFYNCDISNPIEIITSIGNLSDDFIAQDKFGNYLRGWTIDTGLIDEPIEGSEPVLSISLRIGIDLEPNWFVINDREPDGIPISAADRKSVGANWLGTYVDRQLSWGRYSALSRLTGDDSEISNVLADASRQAREAVASASLSDLTRGAEIAADAGEAFGVSPTHGYAVGLDAKLSVSGQATLTLHDGSIPTRMSGLGSRRLLTLAIQHQSVPSGGIMLIDEIEVGLEPHRLRHLLRTLRPTDQSCCQVFITSHSNVTIEELNAPELFIVHSNNSVLDIRQSPIELQALLRKAPEAFLGHRIISCEGPTEVGFIRALDIYWNSQDVGTLPPFACLGVIPITSSKGGGSDIAEMSKNLRSLGFEVLYFGDSDVLLNPTKEELETLGVAVLIWDDEKCIEERICLDLPVECLDDFIAGTSIWVDQRGKNIQDVYDSIGSEFGLKSGQFNGSVAVLIENGINEQDIRIALGKKANNKGWFKTIAGGEILAHIVLSNIANMPGTDILEKISQIRSWVHE